jgi:hypothetical protein
MIALLAALAACATSTEALSGAGIGAGKSLHRIAEIAVQREVEAAGFRLVAEGGFLRNPGDPRTAPVANPAQANDEFVLKFVKPWQPRSEATMQHSVRNILGMLAVAVLIVGCATPPDRTAGASGTTEIWWLGQSAMRITTPGGKVIMIDPWILGNPKTPAQYKNLDALGKIDVILVTHAHGDHSGDAVALAKKNNVPVWGPAGLNQQWQTLGELSAELSPRMNKSGTIQPFPGVKITQVHAEHSSEILWTDPATKKQHTLFGGEPVGLSSNLKTASGSITWATRGCLAT